VLTFFLSFFTRQGRRRTSCLPCQQQRFAPRAAKLAASLDLSRSTQLRTPRQAQDRTSKNLPARLRTRYPCVALLAGIRWPLVAAAHQSAGIGRRTCRLTPDAGAPFWTISRPVPQRLLGLVRLVPFSRDRVGELMFDLLARALTSTCKNHTMPCR